MKRVMIATAGLLALSAQPAEASFLKNLIREGAAQLKAAGRQQAEAAIQKAVGAVQQAGSAAGQPRTADPLSEQQADLAASGPQAPSSSPPPHSPALQQAVPQPR